MLKKLGKKIINNFGLKLLAAMFAVVLWVIVVNIDDPVKVLPFTIAITMENEEFITSQNRYMEVLDGKNTVSFSVSAQRTIHEKITSSDFSAIADMEKIEYDAGSDTYRVPIEITANKYSDDITITPKQKYLEVTLEDLGTVQKVITASTKGTVADGCALGTVELETRNVLQVSGPLALVSQIDRAIATINVEGMSTDVTDSVVPVLYDKDGNEIDTTKLTLSLTTVTIRAQILNTKDVALEFKTNGNGADGYMVTGMEYQPQSVRIKGEAATLNTVNKITIPEEVLDLTEVTDDFETVVDISSYLPKDTALVISSDAKVTIKVLVEPIVTKSFEVPIQNLTVENLREGYEVEFGTEFITVEVAGAESTMKDFTEKDITGTIDAAGLRRGNHNVKVVFLMDQELYMVTADVNVPIIISGTESSSGNSSSDTNTGNSADNNTPANNGSTGGNQENTGENQGNAGESTGSDENENLPDENGAPGGNTEGVHSTESGTAT